MADTNNILTNKYHNIVESQELDDHECSICLDVVKDKIITLNKCKHNYHQTCIQSWFEKSNTCPLCRETILDMYKVKYLKAHKLYRTSIKSLIELKENKIVFYKIKNNKDSKFCKNYLLQDYDDNNTNYPTLNLEDKNCIINLKPEEEIGEFQIQILYIDIFKVSCRGKIIKFFFLQHKKGKKNAVRVKHTNKNIKIKFPTIALSLNFFETLKKRHQYYRDTNY